MKKRYDRELTAAELAAIPDNEIDFSDIPEIDPEWFKTAKRITLSDSMPTEQISLRVSSDILRFFRSSGRGYQTRMNAVLRAYVNAHQPRGET